KELNRYALAAVYYEKVVAVNPYDYKAYWQLCSIYLKLNKYEKAIQCLKKVYEINPNALAGKKIADIYNFKNRQDTDPKSYYLAAPAIGPPTGLIAKMIPFLRALLPILISAATILTLILILKNLLPFGKNKSTNTNLRGLYWVGLMVGFVPGVAWAGGSVAGAGQIVVVTRRVMAVSLVVLGYLAGKRGIRYLFYIGCRTQEEREGRGLGFKKWLKGGVVKVCFANFSSVRGYRERLPGLLRLFKAIVLIAGVFFVIGVSEPRAAITFEEKELSVAGLLSGVYRNKTVIFIIDSFGYKESHGNLVEQILRKSSFYKCEIKQLSVGEGYLQCLVEILDYIEENPNAGVVVNISLGSYELNLPEYVLIKALSGEGAIIVAAAGNENSSEPFYPAAYEEEVIAVAAVNSADRKTEYSNYGSYIDLAADGHGNTEIKSIRRRDYGIYAEENTIYLIRGGTSFATPRVAGFIGYLLQQRPDLTSRKIIELIKDNAKPLTRDRDYNFGELGKGRISILRTLLKVDSLYQKIFFGHLLSIVLGVAFIFIGVNKSEKIWDETGSGSGLKYIGLILTAILFFANLFLINKYGLINGSIIGAILIIMSSGFISMKYYFVVKKSFLEKAEKVKKEPLQTKSASKGAFRSKKKTRHRTVKEEKKELSGISFDQTKFLIKLLKSQDVETRIATAKDLSRILLSPDRIILSSYTQAIEALSEAVNDSEPKVRAIANKTLKKLDRGKKQKNKPFSSSVRDEKGDVSRILKIILLIGLGLSQIGCSVNWGFSDARVCLLLIVIIPSLIWLLDLDVLSMLSDLAGRLGYLSPFIKKLDDSEWFVRSIAARALGRFGYKRATESLIEKLDDVDARVRETALGALEKLGTLTIELELRRYSNDLNDPDKNVRKLVRSEKTLPILVEIAEMACEVQDKHSLMSVKRVFNDIGEIAIPYVAELFKNNKEDIRYIAVGIIGEIMLKHRNSQNIKYLVKAREDMSPKVGRLAEEFINKLQSKSERSSSSQHPVIFLFWIPAFARMTLVRQVFIILIGLLLLAGMISFVFSLIKSEKSLRLGVNWRKVLGFAFVLFFVFVSPAWAGGFGKAQVVRIAHRAMVGSLVIFGFVAGKDYYECKTGRKKKVKFEKGVHVKTYDVKKFSAKREIERKAEDNLLFKIIAEAIQDARRGLSMKGVKGELDKQIEYICKHLPDSKEDVEEKTLGSLAMALGIIDGRFGTEMGASSGKTTGAAIALAYYLITGEYNGSNYKGRGRKFGAMYVNYADNLSRAAAIKIGRMFYLADKLCPDKGFGKITVRLIEGEQQGDCFIYDGSKDNFSIKAEKVDISIFEKDKSKCVYSQGGVFFVTGYRPLYDYLHMQSTPALKQELEEFKNTPLLMVVDEPQKLGEYPANIAMPGEKSVDSEALKIAAQLAADMPERIWQGWGGRTYEHKRVSEEPGLTWWVGQGWLKKQINERYFYINMSFEKWKEIFDCALYIEKVYWPESKLKDELENDREAVMKRLNVEAGKPVLVSADSGTAQPGLHLQGGHYPALLAKIALETGKDGDIEEAGKSLLSITWPQFVQGPNIIGMTCFSGAFNIEDVEARFGINKNTVGIKIPENSLGKIKNMANREIQNITLWKLSRRKAQIEACVKVMKQYLSKDHRGALLVGVESRQTAELFINKFNKNAEAGHKLVLNQNYGFIDEEASDEDIKIAQAKAAEEDHFLLFINSRGFTGTDIDFKDFTDKALKENGLEKKEIGFLFTYGDLSAITDYQAARRAVRSPKGKGEVIAHFWMGDPLFSEYAKHIALMQWLRLKFEFINRWPEKFMSTKWPAGSISTKQWPRLNDIVFTIRRAISQEKIRQRKHTDKFENFLMPLWKSLTRTRDFIDSLSEDIALIRGMEEEDIKQKQQILAETREWLLYQWSEIHSHAENIKTEISRFNRNHPILSHALNPVLFPIFVCLISREHGKALGGAATFVEESIIKPLQEQGKVSIEFNKLSQIKADSKYYWQTYGGKITVFLFVIGLIAAMYKYFKVLDMNKIVGFAQGVGLNFDKQGQFVIAAAVIAVFVIQWSLRKVFTERILMLDTTMEDFGANFSKPLTEEKGSRFRDVLWTSIKHGHNDLIVKLGGHLNTLITLGAIIFTPQFMSLNMGLNLKLLFTIILASNVFILCFEIMYIWANRDKLREITSIPTGDYFQLIWRYGVIGFVLSAAYRFLREMPYDLSLIFVIVVLWGILGIYMRQKYYSRQDTSLGIQAVGFGLGAGAMFGLAKLLEMEAFDLQAWLGTVRMSSALLFPASAVLIVLAFLVFRRVFVVLDKNINHKGNWASTLFTCWVTPAVLLVILNTGIIFALNSLGMISRSFYSKKLTFETIVKVFKALPLKRMMPFIILALIVFAIYAGWFSSKQAGIAVVGVVGTVVGVSMFISASEAQALSITKTNITQILDEYSQGELRYKNHKLFNALLSGDAKLIVDEHGLADRFWPNIVLERFNDGRAVSGSIESRAELKNKRQEIVKELKSLVQEWEGYLDKVESAEELDKLTKEYLAVVAEVKKPRVMKLLGELRVVLGELSVKQLREDQENLLEELSALQKEANEKNVENTSDINSKIKGLTVKIQRFDEEIKEKEKLVDKYNRLLGQFEGEDIPLEQAQGAEQGENLEENQKNRIEENKNIVEDEDDEVIEKNPFEEEFEKLKEQLSKTSGKITTLEGKISLQEVLIINPSYYQYWKNIRLKDVESNQQVDLNKLLTSAGSAPPKQPRQSFLSGGASLEVLFARVESLEEKVEEEKDEFLKKCLNQQLEEATNDWQKAFKKSIRDFRRFQAITDGKLKSGDDDIEDSDIFTAEEQKSLAKLALHRTARQIKEGQLKEQKVKLLAGRKE
ncbi:MAG: S8 family serine peptidase, partial [Candidatus Omnitrophota bacterium]